MPQNGLHKANNIYKHSQRAQISEGCSLLLYCPNSVLAIQRGYPDHTQTSINCSLGYIIAELHCIKFRSSDMIAIIYNNHLVIYSFATKYKKTVIIFQALGELIPPPGPDHAPDGHQNLITCFVYHLGPLHKISL